MVDEVTGRSRWRTVVSVILMVVGLVLAPLGVAAAWASSELTSTDRFVATLGPLGADPQIQLYLADQVTATVNQAVDIDGLVDSAFDAATQNLGPVPSASLRLLQGTVADGLKSLVTKAVTGVMTSDRFPAVWDQVLRTSHQQATNLLSGEQDTAVSTRGDQIVLNIGPLLAQVQQRLKADGFPLTDKIPTGDHYVTLASVSALPTAQRYYGLAVLAGWLLPVLSILALVGALILARPKAVAVLVVGAGLLVGMCLLLFGLSMAEGAVVDSVAAPSAVSQTVFDALVSFLRPLVAALATLGGIMLVIGLLGLPARWATAARQGTAVVVDAGHGWLEERGVVSPTVTREAYRRRTVVWWTIVVVAVAAILLIRPLSAGLVIGTTALAVLAALALALLAGSKAPQPPTPA